ncbi:MAG TPA: PaaI family thioesterase [Dehalococcoidia bacterium]|nr:PaaI family thioesterase [Dehalococcoidia bacterium]
MSASEPRADGRREQAASVLASLPDEAWPLALQGVEAARYAVESDYGYLGGLVNMQVVESEDGDSVLSMEVTPNALNSAGYVHGGFLFTLADYAMGAAARSLIDADHRVVTLEAKANYLGNVRQGRLIARCHTLHHGRHVIMLETRILDAKTQELIVIVTGTFYVVQQDSGSS